MPGLRAVRKRSGIVLFRNLLGQTVIVSQRARMHEHIMLHWHHFILNPVDLLQRYEVNDRVTQHCAAS